MHPTCKNGHVRTAENTYVYAKNGGAQCKDCRTQWKRQRGVQPKGPKTHCKRGHEFTPENIYTNPADGIRHCRICGHMLDVERSKRDRMKRNAQANARYHAQTAEERRAPKLRVTFGLTLDQYKAMLAAQGGVCAICGTDNPAGHGKRFFSVDHDRSCCPGTKSCGRCVRGLLCGHCNVLLGNARENVATLQSAIAYLSR